jgi:hypothetical protein
MEIDHEIFVRFVEALLSNPNVWDRNQPDKNLNELLSTASVATQKVLYILDDQDAIDEDNISNH